MLCTGNADRDKCIELVAQALQPALRPEAIAKQLDAALLKCCAPGGTPSLRYKQRLRSLWPILHQDSDGPAQPLREALLRGALPLILIAEGVSKIQSRLIHLWNLRRI